LRCGGTGNDFLSYEFGGDKCPGGKGQECLNQTWWDNLYTLAENSKAHLVFGLNIHPVDATEAPWNPNNAINLIKYIIQKHQSIFGFELGNEQNGIMTVQEEADAFTKLASVLETLYPDAATRPKLIGPDTHSYHGDGKDNPTFLGQFIQATKGMMYAITHHEYIETTSSNYNNPEYLDRTEVVAKMVQETVTKYSPNSEIWGGEIGPANGGTGGACGNYASTFWYLNTLGTKAKYGYKVFCRQDIIGAAYGLLSDDFASPSSISAPDNIVIHPDYWIGVLWHLLMDTGVINTTSSSASFKAFGHCSKQFTGGLALVVINLSNTASETVSLGGEFGATRIEYILSPPSNGVFGNGILLNGKELVLENGKLPTITGKTVSTNNPLQLSPLSSGFIIYPDAHLSICK
jgi:hypothetical protein